MSVERPCVDVLSDRCLNVATRIGLGPIRGGRVRPIRCQCVDRVIERLSWINFLERSDDRSLTILTERLVGPGDPVSVGAVSG